MEKGAVSPASSLEDSLSGLHYYDDGDAPEVVIPDKAANAPLTIIHSGPEPIKTEPSSSHRKYTFEFRRRTFWLAVASFIIIALTVGLSVGLCLSNQAPQGSSGAQDPQHNGRIINDSSLAAVTSPNGDRVVCFLDGDNRIGRVIYSQASNTWTSVDSLPVGSIDTLSSGILNVPAPRNNTPLALSIYEQSINLFYIDGNNQVTECTLDSLGGSWNSSLVNVTAIPDAFAHPEARTLSAAGAWTPNGTAWNQTFDSLLMFEDPSGRVSAFHQFVYAYSPSSVYQAWTNISETLWSSSANASFKPPFTANCLGATPLFQAQCQAVFVDPSGSNYSNVAWSSFDPNSQTFDSAWVNFASGQHDNSALIGLDLSPVDSSDLLLLTTPEYVGLWINDTVATWFNNWESPAPPPPGEFPFTKLAALTSANGTTSTYIYNQMNASALAEQVYDSTSQTWARIYIDLDEIWRSSSAS